jgi:DNA-binding MarR family transcriptional regulator
MNTTSSEAGGSLELATELADLFRAATRRLQRRTRDTLRPFGLSGSQARVVQLLADGQLRMSDIAQRLTVVPRTATDVVDGCERAGVVVRRPDPEDRRSTLVALTPMGRQLLDQLAEARRESAALVFGPLSDRQRTELLALLREIIGPEGDRR